MWRKRGELSIQHMAATSLNTTSLDWTPIRVAMLFLSLLQLRPAAAMLEILDEAELTFRHHKDRPFHEQAQPQRQRACPSKDPFVVASQLTSSTFDMVLSEAIKLHRISSGTVETIFVST